MAGLVQPSGPSLSEVAQSSSTREARVSADDRREGGKTRAELAGKARQAWNDPDVVSPRDPWVRYDDDDSVIAWGFMHGILP